MYALQRTATTALELHDGDAAISRVQFQVLANGGVLLLPFVQAFSWIPRVKPSEREGFEAQARQQVREVFEAGLFNASLIGGEQAIEQLQFTRGGGVAREALEGDAEYYPVYYIEPLRGNAQALLFDLGSSEQRLQALTLAMESDACVTTAHITLVQESGSQLGVLIFCPVHARNLDTPTAGLPSNGTVGLSSTVLRLGDYMENIVHQFALEPNLRLCLLDTGIHGNDEPEVLHCTLREENDNIIAWNGAMMSEEQRSIALDPTQTIGVAAHDHTLNMPARTWVLRVIDTRDPPISETSIRLLVSSATAAFCASLGVWFVFRRHETDRFRIMQHQKMAVSVSEAKTEFLRYVFHEMRVPFHALSLGLAALEMDALGGARGSAGSQVRHRMPEESRREIYAALRASADQTARVLNDTLDLQTMEAGKFELTKVPLVLSTVVQHVVEAFRPAAAAESVELRVYLSDAVRSLPRMMADEATIRQALGNFISNAIKFSGKSDDGRGAQVVIRVTALPYEDAIGRQRTQRVLSIHDRTFTSPGSAATALDDDYAANCPFNDAKVHEVVLEADDTADSNHEACATCCKRVRKYPSPSETEVAGEAKQEPTYVVFSVADNGVGIGSDDLPRLFNPFVQVYGGKDRLGTGLGLNLMRHYVLRHGGALGARSTLNKGTDFWFMLPLVAATRRASHSRIVTAASPYHCVASPHSALGSPSAIDYLGGRREQPRDAMSPFDRYASEPRGASERKDAAAGPVVASGASGAGTSGPPQLSRVEATRELCGVIRILLVDDDRATRRMTSMFLRGLGIAHDLAADGSQAAEAFANTMGYPLPEGFPHCSPVRDCIDPETYNAADVDLILMDRTMPGMSGDETCSMLRAMGVTIPIIGLTGNALDIEQREFLASGLTALLTKPLRADDLLRCFEDVTARGLLVPRGGIAVGISHSSRALSAVSRPQPARSLPPAFRGTTERTPLPPPRAPTPPDGAGLPALAETDNSESEPRRSSTAGRSAIYGSLIGAELPKLVNDDGSLRAASAVSPASEKRPDSYD